MNVSAAEIFEARGRWNLYKSQEKVLKAYRDSGGNANHYDSLPIDIVNKLESIRNSETLWSDVNRWLWDNPSKNKNPYGGFHSMWDAEGDLKRFMAERKLRRRTTFSWTKGIEEGFADENGLVQHREIYDMSHPYSSDSDQNSKNSYYIDNLPEGYHLHLWKPIRRNSYWTMYYKSPHADWKVITRYRKNEMKELALNLYNTDIAKPTEYALSPMERLMIQQGMNVEKGLITRTQIDNPKGKGGAKIIYYYSPPQTEPKPFAMIEDIRQHNLDYVYDGDMPKELRNFWRGLIFLGFEKAGSVRSVNRYNKDRKQWVASHPAWFKNLCAQGITQCSVQDIAGDYCINGITFVRFNSQGFQIRKPMEEEVFYTPRASTQRKMREKAQAEGLTSRTDIRAHIFYQCVKKYNPQDYPSIKESFTNEPLQDEVIGFIWGKTLGKEWFIEAGKYMCRRFKKN